MLVKVYTVTIGGIPHTFQLSDVDAKAQGLTSADEVKAPEEKAAPKVANKSRTAKNKSA